MGCRDCKGSLQHKGCRDCKGYTDCRGSPRRGCRDLLQPDGERHSWSRRLHRRQPRRDCTGYRGCTDCKGYTDCRGSLQHKGCRDCKGLLRRKDCRGCTGLPLHMGCRDCKGYRQQSARPPAGHRGLQRQAKRTMQRGLPLRSEPHKAPTRSPRRPHPGPLPPVARSTIGAVASSADSRF